MNDRRGVLVAIGAGALVAPLRSFAQKQTGRIAKIGLLESGSIHDRSSAFGKLFRGALGELGLDEGRNLAIEYRSAENRLDRLPALADELVRLNVDLIVTVATPAALAAKNATRTIPVLFIQLAVDPVAAGLVDSLARPGANVTGLTQIAAELAGKRLGLLKETVPRLSTVAVMWEPKNGGSEQAWKDSRMAVRELGLELYSMEVMSADEFDEAFRKAINAHSTALSVTPMILVSSNMTRVLALAEKHRLPAIYWNSRFVEGGGLMSYGSDVNEHYKRAALYVDKILKGTRPADLPVDQPTKFELSVNLKAAKRLGLELPANLLVRADRLIH